MTTTATRLITLIMLLQRHPNQKAGELARELDVSVRTLHRYFAMLDEMGIPIFSDARTYGGFSLVRGYKLPPLVFTPEEAVAISLGTGLVKDMWGELYREAARGALAKLENVLPEEQRREAAWARRTLVSTGLHRAGPGGRLPHSRKTPPGGPRTSPGTDELSRPRPIRSKCPRPRPVCPGAPLGLVVPDRVLPHKTGGSHLPRGPHLRADRARTGFRTTPGF